MAKIKIRKKAQKRIDGTVKRAYRGRTADMLTIGGEFADYLKEKKGVLIAKRAVWVDPFFDELVLEANGLFKEVTGMDRLGAMKERTMVVNVDYNRAKELFGDLAPQLEDDLREQPDLLQVIVDKTGMGTLLEKATKGDQVQMATLLNRFAENITPYRTTIEGLGVDKATIDELIGLAESLHRNNLLQEGQKTTGKLSTAEKELKCNAFYVKLMGIVKTAKRFLRDDVGSAEVLNYAGALRRLHFQGKAAVLADS